jgi:DNA-binding transcriptional LysR family regulator
MTYCLIKVISVDSKILRVFRAVADTGSISAAAERLCTVQSNVTAHVKRLERELGLALFHRKPRGVELTAAGEVLLAYARRVDQLLDEAATAVQDSGDAMGRLRLGTLETLAAVRLPPVLAQFRRTFPQVELQLTTGSTEFLAGEVLEFHLDGAFVAGAVDHPHVEQTVLREEELVVVTEASRTEVGNLQDQVLLVFRPGCAFRARAEQWLREEGLLPLRKMEFGALDAIIGCVSAGMGITLLPRVVVERPQYRKLVRTHRIPERYASIATSFICRDDVLRTRALSELVGMATTVMSAAPSG